jgi:isopenicillin-N N-acyltransferase-like protein
MRRFTIFPLLLMLSLVAPARAEFIARQGKGWLERQQGLLILHVEGTPHEMGFQQGALLKDHIPLILQGVSKDAAGLAQDMGIADPNPVLDMLWAQLAAHTPKDYLDEMAGVAEGAGIDVKDIQRMCTAVEAGEIMRTCSSFCAWGKATAGGTMFQIRNLDYTTDVGLQDHAILLVARPQGKFMFAAPSYAGFVGVVSGMNEKGIALGEIGAGASEAERNFDAIPMPFLLRSILESCDSAEKAAQMVKNASRTAGFNYVFGDPGHQTARATETSSKYFAVYKDNDPAEAKIAGSHVMENVVIRADGVADAKRIAEAKHETVGGDDRYQKMAQMIAQDYGKLDAQKVIAISRAVAMTGSLHCVVYDNTDREMWVANAIGPTRAAETPYLHFKLSELFAAQAPSG